MSALGPFLRKTEQGFLHWCPGCKHAHHIWVGNDKGPNWTFDGNFESPTFRPSVRHFTPVDPEDGTPETTECHYFVTAGHIQFCGDCQHELRGKTVSMEPFSESYAT